MNWLSDTWIGKWNWNTICNNVLNELKTSLGGWMSMKKLIGLEIVEMHTWNWICISVIVDVSRWITISTHNGIMNLIGSL